MPKKYEIAWKIDDRQAMAAFRRGDAAMRRSEAAMLRMANAAQQQANAAASGAAAAAQQHASAAQRANAAAVRGRKAAVDQIQAVEDRYYMKDYRMLVRRERDRQRMDDFARARTEKAIRDREGLEQAWLVRDYKARVANERRKEKLAEQQAARAARDQDALERRAMQAEQRDEKRRRAYSERQAKLAEQQARRAEAAAMGPYGRLSQVRRKDLTEEQLTAAAVNKLRDLQHNNRIKQIMKERGANKDNFAQSIADAFGFSSALTKVGVALAGVSAGAAVVKAIASSFAAAKQASEDLARQTLDTSAALREIAAIKEKYAPDEAELAHHLAVRAASGMTQDQALEYQEGLANALGTVSKGKMDDAERQKLETLGSVYVARTSRNAASARARADALGMLPNFLPGKVSAGSAVDMADAVDVILGRGAASQQVMTEQYRELLTALTGDEEMVGFFKDPRKAAALTSVASSFEKGAPGTATLEAVRALRGFTRFRKIKGLDASQAQTLQAAGITEQMDPYEAMTSLFKFADSNLSGGEAFDAFLARRGFRNETANTRLAQFYSAYKKGTLSDIMGMAEQPVEPGAAERKNQAYLQSPVGRDLVSKALVESAKTEEGKRAQELLIAKQQTEAAMIGKGLDTTISGQLSQRAAGVLGASYLTGRSGRDTLIEGETLRRLRREAGQPVAPKASWLETGLNFLPGPFAPVGHVGSAALGYSRTPFFDAAFRDNSDAVTELTKAIRENNELTKRGLRDAANVPPALPVGRPAAGAMRP